MNDKYITAEEFIKLKNITMKEFFNKYFSGVYSGYTKSENGKTLVSIELVDDYIDTTPTEETETTEETAKPKAEKKPDEIERLNAEIERLRKELAEKDKQIIDCLNKFAELTEKALQITSQGQYIQALDKAPETAIAEELPQTDIVIHTKKQNIFHRIFKKK